jgi:hypothetical protein
MKTTNFLIVLILCFYIIGCRDKKDEKSEEKKESTEISKKFNDKSEINSQLENKQKIYKEYLDNITLLKTFITKGEFSHKFFVNNRELTIKSTDYAKLEMNYYISDTVKYKLIKPIKDNFEIEKTTQNRISIIKNYKKDSYNLGFNFKDNIYISIVSGLVSDIGNQKLDDYENFCIVFTIGSITVYINESSAINKILIVARSPKMFLLDRSYNVLATDK